MNAGAIRRLPLTIVVVCGVSAGVGVEARLAALTFLGRAGRSNWYDWWYDSLAPSGASGPSSAMSKRIAATWPSLDEA